MVGSRRVVVVVVVVVGVLGRLKNVGEAARVKCDFGGRW